MARLDTIECRDALAALPEIPDGFASPSVFERRTLP